MTLARKVAAGFAALLGFVTFAVGSYAVIAEGLGFAGSGTPRLSAALALVGAVLGWWLVAPSAPEISARSAERAAARPPARRA